MDKKIIKLVNELDLNKKSSWYKNIYATSIVILIIILFAAIACLFNNVTYSKSSVRTPFSMWFAPSWINNFQFKHDMADLNSYENWLLENKSFHPLKEANPFEGSTSEEFLKQNASEYIHQN